MPSTTASVIKASQIASNSADQGDLSSDSLAKSDLTTALELCENASPELLATTLKSVLPDRAFQIYSKLCPETQANLNPFLNERYIAQWKRNATFPENTIGRLMEPAFATLLKETSVAHAIEHIRDECTREFITYLYVVDDKHALVGLVVMRDLLLAEPSQSLADIMLTDVFCLKPSTEIMQAMRNAISRHYPVYPITDENGVLVGLVRGARLFEAQAFEISAQAGSMVGVEKEERSSTHWLRSFLYRHPWLQLNLLTAFLAGAVVNAFQGTIDQIVILASFLPILAGQSGNTGCQSLAVTLRGLTLGELDPSRFSHVVIKEGFLGILNGCLVGLTAGAAMFLLAYYQDIPHAGILSLVVFIAMVGSCCISGLSGVIVPMTLKKIGADPATASSIFLTTTTDVASMGMLLALATALLL